MEIAAEVKALIAEWRTAGLLEVDRPTRGAPRAPIPTPATAPLLEPRTVSRVMDRRRWHKFRAEVAGSGSW
jgi:hypothetical protein